MIADMLVWDRSELRGSPERGEYLEFYTCKHVQPNGDCGTYDRRPTHMCGAYPYGKPCEHGSACAWDAGRAGLWPPKKVDRVKGLRRIVLGDLDPARQIVRRVHLPIAAPRG